MWKRVILRLHNINATNVRDSMAKLRAQFKLPGLAPSLKINQYTVKPELTTTSEQRPPVNNGQCFEVPIRPFIT